MGEWSRTTLGEVLALEYGKALPERVRDGKGSPVLGSNGVVGYHSAPLVSGPGIVVGRKGTAGSVRRVDSDFFPIDTTYFVRLRDTTATSMGFAAHMLVTADLPGICAQTGVPGLNRDRAYELPVLLPPLPAQRRIVDVMSAVDAQIEALDSELGSTDSFLVALRRQTFEQAQASSTTADEMFDMLLGRQKSERQSVGDHVIPYLRAANIGDYGLKLVDVQTMNFDPAEQVKYCLRAGDVLVVEGGSVGIAVRWTGEIEGPVGFDKHVIRFRASTGRSISEYALQWAKWSRETGAFDRQATGITIRALGFGRASAMEVPDLSVAVQDKLMTPLAALEVIRERLIAELGALRAFRSSLLTALLSQAITIPEAYDALLEVAA